VDIDHQAVEVTKLSLLLKVLEGEDEQSIGRQMTLFQERVLPDLSNNIKSGNSLIGPDFYETQQMSLLDEEEIYRVNAFDWDAEFADIMKNGDFDAVIGNPPWGANLSLNDKKYLSQKYKSFSGNHDSYLFFIEKLTTLVKSKGYASFITPDTWIKAPQAEKLRRIVLEKKGIKLITTLPSKVFKKVSANCIIFVLGRSNNKRGCSINLMLHDSDLSLLEKEEFNDTYKVKVSYWSQSDDCQFQIYQKNEMAELFFKIKSSCTQARTYLDVMQGIVPYSRENHSEDIVKNRLFHSSEKISEEYGVWIQGRSISRYKIKTDKKEYLRYGKWLHRPRKKKYFEGPRILIQEITAGNPSRISACCCDSVLYHDPGIISCLNIGETDILFLLGILNSSFLSWYHRYSSPKGIRKAFPKVLIGDIRKFPIPLMVLEDKKQKSYHDQIAHSVKQIIDLHRQIDQAKAPQTKTVLQRQIETTDKQIDQLVYELYDLTDEEIKIVESET
jgi:type I restriction-modification system DNA methylase subunit